MSDRVILCYGDSNTHGASAIAADGSWTRHDAATRWPMRLAAALGPGYRVIEEGLPGRTTCLDDPFEGEFLNGLRVLPAVLRSHKPVDLVVLMLGTNDLKARFSMTAADIAKGIARLITEIRRHACGPGGGDPDILVVAPPPITETGVPAPHMLGGAEKSRALAAEMAAVAAAAGTMFYDAGLVAQVDPLDGIHLDAEAHAGLAEGLARAIRDWGATR
ncbi:SGNH/GDSL hydrolase family protein [Mangrovicoccus algicola]|uniref:SGNH/GDSL hydrolase family protein n=1 Tax=Mangrovicoccus algicola TaxID=2771008 RepID=A0A8J6Z5S1_9RHOB|nr:SGNH/GDSL hydrolase family protein [Mangrovicoccus algicola]MBE3636860.1 SGNH/GDSL hydrolase family protein [Mangrovicoccus algicola]